MTRAVVANLNQQKSASTPNNGTTGQHDGPATSASPSRTPRKSTSPQKSLPLQPSKIRARSKQLPEVPEFYIVRPAPSTSSAKIERNDRRVFINRGTMEKMGVFQGSVVLIQRHDPNRWTPAMAPVLQDDGQEHDSHYPSDDEDDSVEQTTVGVAWPMDRIEPNG